MLNNAWFSPYNDDNKFTLEELQMATKLAKNTFPDGHGTDDFQGFGPVASKDTEWGNSCLADLGCFQQEEVDSNKYYHLAVVQSNQNKKFYAYYEWGRTKPDGRPNKPSFQFFECVSKEDAQATCEKQFKSKNTSRGEWKKVGSKDRFVAKRDSKGKLKDLYVVRETATRMVGLPCVENIANEDAKGAAAQSPKKKSRKKKSSSVDPQTKKLFADLTGGAVTYANAMMSGGKGGKATLPSQSALDEGREILDDAMSRLAVVGDSVDDQVNDQELKTLTYDLYGRIPKAKKQGIAESKWILSKDNIGTWQLDIDALETALQAQTIDVEEVDDGVMAGIPADVSFISPSTEKGKWLKEWWENATRNKHHHIGKAKIHNLWEISRHGDKDIMRKAQEKTLKEMPKNWNNERPMHQEKNRMDLTTAERKLFWKTNTGLLFHGTRSVNVPGIVRENLRFPKELTGVIITGAMFGPGSYFADDFKKSCGYCSNPSSRSRSYYGGGGEVAGRKAFMFAFDVICGNPYVADDAYGFKGPPKGHHSVFGKHGHTASWGTRGGLMNNEWVLYHKGRIEMRYLAEMSW